MSETWVAADLRRLVGERVRGCCEYCRSQARFATEAFSVEHIIPASQSGSTTPENLALACQGCNSHKACKTLARDPSTGEMVPLFHPRQQNWSDHFRWDESFTRIEGCTPIGRATVVELHLNREGLTNLRQVLRLYGVHPPSEPVQ
jgi:HNH endonuclease